MTLGLKFILIFDFKKTPFRYIFLIAIMYSINVFYTVCMCKDAFIKRMDGCSQKLQYKHYMEKNKQGGGVRFKDNKFSGVK